MADDSFDDFLARALAPPERQADRGFVKQMQAIVKLDQRLRTARRMAIRRLGLEALAVGSFGAGLTWLARSPEIAAAIGESPEFALAGLLAAFALLVALMSKDSADQAMA